MERTTRHKSCLACIQTKRKCDRNQPSCQRCIARGSDCLYIGRTRSQQRPTTEQSLATVSDLQVAQSSGLWQLQQYIESQYLDSTILSPSSSNQISFDYATHPFNVPIDNHPILPTTVDTTTLQLLHTSDTDTKLRARVDYCAGRLSLLPHIFASSGQNMFIHRQTFQALQSPALQQAMSASALYRIENAGTKSIIHQILHNNVQHLLATTNAAQSSNSDLLAALQALLLYQIMRLFDGDIRLRVCAEADEATTVLWASELRSRACHMALPRHPLAPVTVVAASTDRNGEWQEWLFSESIRRTVVTTFMLQGVYNYIKTGHDNPTVVGVYFSAQERLWNAQSELGWCHARQETVELQVSIGCWDEIMALAEPDDLEELGVLVMSMLWGLSATQNWLGQERSVKYGLDCQPSRQSALDMT